MNILSLGFPIRTGIICPISRRNGELPDMLPPGEDHIFYSSSMITKVDYSPGNIAYTSLDKAGTERIKLTFVPEVFSNGKLLNEKYWSFGDFRGINNVLIIKRLGVNKIEIRKK